MNERIKELVEQTGVPLSMPFDQWCAKFAELIVKECIYVINQPNGVGDDDVIKITDDIEKHFGVEA